MKWLLQPIGSMVERPPPILGISGRLWVRVPCWLIHCPHGESHQSSRLKSLLYHILLLLLSLTETEKEQSRLFSYPRSGDRYLIHRSDACKRRTLSTFWEKSVICRLLLLPALKNVLTLCPTELAVQEMSQDEYQ